MNDEVFDENTSNPGDVTEKIHLLKDIVTKTTAKATSSATDACFKLISSVLVIRDNFITEKNIKVKAGIIVAMTVKRVHINENSKLIDGDKLKSHFT